MAKTAASKSLGTLLVIIGSILLFIVCAEFIWHITLALGALYVIAYGLELRGSPSLPNTIGIWFSRAWGSSTRHYDE